jgi:ABC-type nitrate/sulfonate/bicarbonate transport system ATPase subunit
MDEPFGALDTHTKTRLHADVLMIALRPVDSGAPEC